jgi:hypothetical protein
MLNDEEQKLTNSFDKADIDITHKVTNHHLNPCSPSQGYFVNGESKPYISINHMHYKRLSSLVVLQKSLLELHGYYVISPLGLQGTMPEQQQGLPLYNIYPRMNEA